MTSKTRGAVYWPAVWYLPPFMPKRRFARVRPPTAVVPVIFAPALLAGTAYQLAGLSACAQLPLVVQPGLSVELAPSSIEELRRQTPNMLTPAVVQSVFAASL